jgi:hypothetical protein
VLVDKSFRGWPTEEQAGQTEVKQVFSAERDSIRLSAFDFSSQPAVQLRLYLMHRTNLNKPRLIVLNVLGEREWSQWLSTMRVGFAHELADETAPEPNEDDFKKTREMLNKKRWVMAYVSPRGIGPAAWDADERKLTQIRRRFMLLGQTLDGMRVWDVRRAIQALRTISSIRGVPLSLRAEERMAGLAAYASLFEPDIIRLELWHPPRSHRDGPIFLNVLRFLDMPQAIAMAAERSQVRIYQKDGGEWQYADAVAGILGWPKKQLQILKVEIAVDL